MFTAYINRELSELSANAGELKEEMNPTAAKQR
jgi:hypothetical protein